MEFLTLHELSVLLDTSVRVLRHRVRQLLQSGKLAEGRDCRRDDFVDAKHFVWKIDPVAYQRATGNRVVNKLATAASTAGNQADNQGTRTVTRPTAEDSSKPPKSEREAPTMEREMLDFLKGQIGVKDRQIGDLTEQNQKLNDLNVKLVGQSAHQMQRIETLMRLTGGKIELSELVTKPGDDSLTTGNHRVHHPDDHGQQTDTGVDRESPNAVTKVGDNEIREAA